MEFLGRSWAIFGLVGALLVLVPSNGDSEVVGQAALPLLYGILLCGLVGGLFGRKLQVNSQNEVLFKRMAIEGVMAIQAQDNPRIVEHKLAVFIQPKDRPSGKNQETVGPVPVKDHTREELEQFTSAKQELILRLVREAIGMFETEEQKARLEEAVDKVERGEMALVALLAVLEDKALFEILYKNEIPQTPLVENTLSPGFSFEDIAKLTDQEIQRLLREVSQKDQVMALKGASDELMEKILGNMSDRVRSFIESEVAFAHPGPEDVLVAQARIVRQVFQLTGQGKIDMSEWQS